MAANRGKQWVGGYIREGRIGGRIVPIYIIRRRAHGKAHEISTRCTNKTEAAKHLARFEENPEQYAEEMRRTNGAAINSNGPQPICLKDVVAAYLTWCKATTPDKNGNSEVWWKQKKFLLKWWLKTLDGVDLRQQRGGPDLLTARILPALNGIPLDKLGAPDQPAPKPTSSYKHKVAIIKHVYKYLRAVAFQIQRDEDPTLDRLFVPQSRPEQWKLPKPIPFEDIEAVQDYFRKLPPANDEQTEAARRARAAKRGGKYSLSPAGHQWKIDVIDLLLGTGWHFTEILRFVDVENEKSAVLPLPSHREQVNPGGAVLQTSPKRGIVLRTDVTAHVRAAAERLRTVGAFGYSHFAHELNRACDALEIDRFTPGRFRSTVLTDAVDRGEDIKTVASFANHFTMTTTKRFYALYGTPKKVVTRV